METTIPQTKPKTDAEYIAAIEEMQSKIDSSFARMDEMDGRTQTSMQRTEALLTRVEEMQAGRLR